jgi:AAA+ superfamily predicted ATPase
MDSYVNEKGEMVRIDTMDSIRLIHAISKYTELYGKSSAIVNALKTEAIKRLSEPKQQ